MPSSKNSLTSIVDFFFEVGILAKTPRSGFHFLGSGEQSVAEHINRVVYIGYVLAMMEKVDVSKVLTMCLFHDLGEARTSDLNYVHQQYAEADEMKALHDLAEHFRFGEEILAVVKEYIERKTPESRVAKDADNLEWIVALKEQVDIGNARATTWMNTAIKRLTTMSAKKVAHKIKVTDSNHWWAAHQDDSWWVSRTKSSKKEGS